jgi:UDP-N-acetylglucosamine 1-carboxyvinyltransferase
VISQKAGTLHLDCITAKFSEMGVRFESYEDSIRVISTGRLTKTNIKSLPYPSFPTDMQPQISAVLSIAEGTSVVTEGIFNSRFKYLDELKRMGANAQVNGTVAVIEGVDHLTGAAVRACDLRAGAALIVAGLAAQGVTVVEDAGHIERGYEYMVEKLSALGAEIKRTEVSEPDEIVAAG